jgi:hypothetical protein
MMNFLVDQDPENAGTSQNTHITPPKPNEKVDIRPPTLRTTKP